MRYKRLGGVGPDISVIGQGSIGAGSKENASSETIRKRIKTLRHGIELGMNFIDTGEDYEGGHSEEVLGRMMKEVRSKILLCSKFKPSHNSQEGIQQALEGSLRRLRTDTIDLYQVQWPNPSIPVAETIETLASIVDQGKIRYFGVGNFSARQLKEAHSIKTDRSLVSIQTEYDLYNRLAEKEMLPYAEAHQITVLAYPSVGSAAFTADEGATLDRIGAGYGATRRQVALSWLVSHPSVVCLTSSMSVDHTSENAEAANFQLGPEELAAIDRTFHREPVLVPTDRIRVVDSEDSDATHLIYTTLEEAIDNKMNIQPSAAAIAEELRSGEMLRPVELRKISGRSSRFDYGLVRGRMRFWAWIIANGREEPIPALVFGDGPLAD